MCRKPRLELHSKLQLKMVVTEVCTGMCAILPRSSHASGTYEPSKPVAYSKRYQTRNRDAFIVSLYESSYIRTLEADTRASPQLQGFSTCFPGLYRCVFTSYKRVV
jgi:hypothetical protein